MDFLGRKFVMLLLIVPFMVGWLLLIFAANVTALYVGRFLLGLAGGAFFVVCPAYIGEIASVNIRGKLGSYLQLMVTGGILFIYVIGHFFALRTFNIICAIVPILFGALFIWMPETPYFLIMKNQTERAVDSLKWFRGEHYNIDDELEAIRAEQETVRENQESFFTTFSKSSTRRGLLISLSLVIFVQFAGINAVIFYTTFIFKSAKVAIQPSISTIIVGVMQFVATYISSMVVDKMGRRLLLLTSASIMCLCNIGLGIFFYLQDAKSTWIEYLHWLPICSLCLYITAFSLGLG